MPKQLTIRGVPDEVGRRLEVLGRESGRSVNAVVLDILKTALGTHERRQRLARYATWTRQDLADFEEALKAQRTIDEELWN